MRCKLWICAYCKNATPKIMEEDPTFMQPYCSVFNYFVDPVDFCDDHELEDKWKSDSHPTKESEVNKDD